MSVLSFLNRNKKPAAPAEPSAEEIDEAIEDVSMSEDLIPPPKITCGELELINTDDATAAVIMAIVSNKTDIPLHRLNFIRIKLLEDTSA